MTEAVPPPSTLIIAIPGTQETKEMSRQDVLDAIGRGEILPDNWVWSPADNDWKMVSDIPELQPAPAPAPTPSFMNGAVPTAAMSAHFPPSAGKTPAAAQPAAAVVRQPVVQPKVEGRTPALTETQLLARTQYSQPMEVKHEFPIFKVLFFISFVLATSVLGANYFLVDEPFVANLGTTSFGTVKAYAHLGAFSQPGALVIHVPPTDKLNSDNLADFLVALAKSTPLQPFNQQAFNGIGITSAWQSQFLMNGIDWQKLAEMSSATTEEKKKFEIEHLAQIDGTLLIDPRKNNSVEAQNKAWQTFVATLLPKAN